MVSLGGQRYRVVTSAGDEELAHLVGLVERKAKEVGRGRGMTPDCILLTAIAFAHESEAQRARADRILEKAAGFAGGLLGDVEDALGEDEAEGPGEEDV
jgi:cell division protein ZapA (FtsZ GTPase activity inhibitor)